MRYRRMGRSGLKVSEVSLGGWCVARNSFDDVELSHLLSESLERGVNLIDLADIYERGEVEERFGRLLSDYPRHQLVLSTKSYWPMSQGANDCGLSRKHIHESVHASLRRLKTDYLDLFYCQRFDEETPLVETVDAIGDLIKQGKILYWGVCGWTERQVRAVTQLCVRRFIPPPISYSVLYNLIERGAERQLFQVMRELGLGAVVWSSLAGGMLARPSATPPQRSDSGETWVASWHQAYVAHKGVARDRVHHDERLKKLGELSQESGLSPAQLSLAWALRKPEVSSVTLEVSSIEQLRENLEVTQQVISADVISDLTDLFAL